MALAISRIVVLRILVVLVVAVALSVPVLYSFFVYTPTVNLQCGICHTMQFYVMNISKPHAKYSCLVCHEITLGNMGLMMWNYITEGPAPIEVFEKYHPRKNLLDQCNKCHRDFEKLIIHKSHLAVVETVGTCSICHAIHIEKFLANSCTKCHHYPDAVERHMKMHDLLLQFLPAECARCHSPQSPAFIPPADVCLHAVVEGKSCLACHTQLKPPDITDKPCIACHYK